MSLSHLLPLLRDVPGVGEILQRIDQSDSVIQVDDLPSAARPALIAATLAAVARPAVVVTARSDRADELCAAVSEFLPAGRSAVVWPSPDALPYEQLPFDLAAATTGANRST